ncbi:hypothetical protein FGB62_203g015 [Gracilaria domingensis]|nr:hypothetical protein FGB62_203g015 [Gracilaria domingensis]
MDSTTCRPDISEDLLDAHETDEEQFPDYVSADTQPDDVPQNQERDVSWDPSLETPHPASIDLLTYCGEFCVLSGSAELLSTTVTRLESRVPAPYRFVSHEFGSAKELATYLSKWRKSSVTGVFRPLLPVLLELLSVAGGVTKIEDYSEGTVGGERRFSSICDSKAIKEYTKDLNSTRNVLVFDLYIDGHILSNSGSQSANNIRVRLSNVKSGSRQLVEVGIATFLDQTRDKRGPTHMKMRG